MSGFTALINSTVCFVYNYFCLFMSLASFYFHCSVFDCKNTYVTLLMFVTFIGRKSLQKKLQIVTIILIALTFNI